jgi:galactan endo-1,6-beta-galactosidase
MANIANYAEDHWNLEFESVAPFNEPMASWWSSRGAQECCHFDISTQATIIGYLRSELDNRGLSRIMIAASDENSYDQAVSTWRGLGSSARAKVGRIDVHGYQKAGGRRDALYDLVSGQEGSFGTANTARTTPREGS